MKFIIDSAVLAKFPTVRVAVVEGQVSTFSPAAPEIVQSLRNEAEDRLRASVGIVEALAIHPHVSAWREAYRSFGLNPKNNPPTHEALSRRILKGKGWPEIHLLVDIYLTNQVAHLLPHGGYDTCTIEGDISLTISPGGEGFAALGGTQETTEPGEVIYRDSARLLTRGWNSMDCDVTKLTPETRNFVLMIEAPSDAIASDALEKAAQDLIGRYKRCVEGNFRWMITDGLSAVDVGLSEVQEVMPGLS